MNQIPNGSESYKRLNPHLFSPSRLPAVQPKRDQGLPLVNASPRKAKGGAGPVERFEIVITVFAMRPLDWDNHRVKDLQDCLVQAGILPDDNWRVLSGRVISRKADNQKQERTEIEIVKV